MKWWRDKPARTRVAVALLVLTSIGWPVTAALEALGVPIFKQVMIGLSWLAVILVALDILMSAQLHEKHDDDK